MVSDNFGTLGSASHSFLCPVCEGSSKEQQSVPFASLLYKVFSVDVLQPPTIDYHKRQLDWHSRELLSKRDP